MIQVNHHTLPNGLRIVHNEDNSTQMVALNLLYDVGARDEKIRSIPVLLTCLSI